MVQEKPGTYEREKNKLGQSISPDDCMDGNLEPWTGRMIDG